MNDVDPIVRLVQILIFGPLAGIFTTVILAVLFSAWWLAAIPLAVFPWLAMAVFWYRARKL